MRRSSSACSRSCSAVEPGGASRRPARAPSMTAWSALDWSAVTPARLIGIDRGRRADQDGEMERQSAVSHPRPRARRHRRRRGRRTTGRLRRPGRGGGRGRGCRIERWSAASFFLAACEVALEVLRVRRRRRRSGPGRPPGRSTSWPALTDRSRSCAWRAAERACSSSRRASIDVAETGVDGSGAALAVQAAAAWIAARPRTTAPTAPTSVRERRMRSERRSSGS